jgi:hypothetical protein
MVSLGQVEDQLRKVGCNFRFWGRPEVRELCHILIDGEIIAQAVNGRYENGFAMLVVTDHRLLLIDKKPMFLTLEDIRFDMIAEIDFSSQLLDSTVKIITPNRTLVFTSWNQGRMRVMLNYTQQRVSEIRQHYLQRQFQQPSWSVEPEEMVNAVQHEQFQRQWQQTQRDSEFAAPAVGGLALQGGTDYTDYSLPRVPINPYTKMPLTMRHKRVPRFFR